MFNLPIRILHLLGAGALPVPGPLRAPAGRAAWASRAPASHASATETASMSEHYQLELIRSYASSGFTAVVTINSGALIAGLSQAGNLEGFPPAAIAFAVFIWALGVTTGVATWERRTAASWPWPHRIGGSKCTGEASPRGCSTSLWACSCSALRSSAWRSQPGDFAWLARISSRDQLRSSRRHRLADDDRTKP